MASLSSSTTIAVTVAHAVTYLVRPLALRYSTSTLARLQATLEANLNALYQNNWTPSDPSRGSGRRCLSLSPSCLPPRAVYDACVASQVQWADWIRALGGKEFNLFIDPGRVAIRTGASSESVTVWSERLEAKAQMEALARMQKQSLASKQTGKTLAQLLMEQDEESDDEIFSMIDSEVSAPSWMTPLLDQFPKAPRAIPSRSSSRTSFASSTAFSMESDESGTSWSSRTSSSSPSSSPSSCEASLPSLGSRASRRERARQARVFIDTSKKIVTPYDGGKTTVLTGGVMLGNPRAQAGKRF